MVSVHECLIMINRHVMVPKLVIFGVFVYMQSINDLDYWRICGAD